MNIFHLFLAFIAEQLLFGAQLLFAQGPEQQPPPTFFALLLQMAPMFLIVYMIFHWMVLGPQKKKLLEQQKLLESLKRGETVVTSSGIIARVGSIEKDFVVLDAGSNLKLKIEKTHISKRLDNTATEKEGS